MRLNLQRDWNAPSLHLPSRAGAGERSTSLAKTLVLGQRKCINKEITSDRAVQVDVVLQSPNGLWALW